jgi:DNA-binding NarL/FixJ family response regulator
VINERGRIVLDKTPLDAITDGFTALRLTQREAEVFRLVSQGLANKVVASQLRLREGTVKVHLHNIYRKLGITSRAGLVLMASRAAE